MTLVSVAARNVLRNKLRTVLTIVGGAVAVLAFVLLRTVLSAWGAGVEYASKDRLATRNKISISIPLPHRYIDDLKANVPGIKVATYANWFGAKWPRDPKLFFANLAVADDYFDAYPEMLVAPDAMARYKADKQGAIIGDQLAKKLGIKVGDRAVLAGTIYPGDWSFTVDGVYTVPDRASVDRSTFFFHWSYLIDTLNQNSAVKRDKIGWIISRIDDPSKAPVVSAAIDRLFDDRDMQTATMSERALNNSLLSGFSALLSAIDGVSIIILTIMMLILGNTIAMSVRERITEYGVLRALGFRPGHIRVFILGEALTVALSAAVVGLLLAYPIVQVGMGRWLEENMGSFFPYFHITGLTALAALLFTSVLGALAALIPAVRAGNLAVTDALRRLA